MNKVTTPPRYVRRKTPTTLAQDNESLSSSSSSSSSDEDGYLSPFNASDDGTAPFSRAAVEGSLLDEMPPFSACSMSPSGRSLSPIESEQFESPNSTSRSGRSYVGCSTPVYDAPRDAAASGDGRPPAEGYVTLDEIHARIGLTPPDVNVSRSRLNLETIFEGVFLETPPKKEFQSKGNLFRRSMRNRALLFDKADQKENTP